MRSLKDILKTLFPLFYVAKDVVCTEVELVDIKSKPKKVNLKDIKLTGKRVKLLNDYPLNISLKRGNIYDVVEEYTEQKRISYSKFIPINLAEIINEEGEIVLVNLELFEEV